MNFENNFNKNICTKNICPKNVEHQDFGQQNFYTKSWHEIARPEQRIPKTEKWLWLILAGRGFGKTRTGAESVMEMINSGKYKSIAIVGKTISEARDVMVEGCSGILSTTLAQKMYVEQEQKIENYEVLKFNFYRSRNVIIWENGTKAYLIGADHYEKIRGYQFDLVWLDEFAKYQYPEETWKQVMFSLRLGDDPKCIITTTPKPLKILKNLMDSKDTYLTQGSTFQNEKNLSLRFLNTIKETYGNTWLGKQELEGKLLMIKENTVWKKSDIRYSKIEEENLERIVIGVDPAVSSSDHSDETGIIIAGIGYDENIYVLDDLSGKYNSHDWAKIICRACYDYKATCIVAETNNGGDLVGAMIKTINQFVPFKQVHAIKGKLARAEPIALLYSNNRVFHVKEFCELEEQMCDLSYDDKIEKSPDRVDALVWAISELKSKKDHYSISVIGT